MMTAEGIVAAIDAAKDRRGASAPRRYIGASMVAKPCDAFMAFSLRGFPEDPISPRLRRIFRLGNILEDEIVRDLKAAGLNVEEVDPIARKQHAWSLFGGHVKAHADGLVYESVDGADVVRGLELKSMGSKPFGDFKANGVRRSHPVYFGQMTCMMGLSGLREFVFVAYCKDNSEYAAEIVAFDEFEWSYLRERIERVMRGEAQKIAPSPNDWRCRFCSRQGVCWNGAPVPPECATCAHAAPRADGLWHCLKHEREAVTACDDWRRYEPRDA